MSDRSLPPIRSSREHEPDLEPEIDAFVLSLGEIVDSFQDAEAAGALPTLEKLASDLRARAGVLGYEPLVDAVTRVRAACGERNPEAVRKAVQDLTDVAQRVRRGHRSAAS